MSSFGLRIKSNTGNYLVSEQTTNLSLVKRCIGFDPSNTIMDMQSFGDGVKINYKVDNCPGVPIPFFTAPAQDKLYAVTQVYPTGVANEWNVELITNATPDDAPNFSTPSNVAVPPTGFSMTLGDVFDFEWYQTAVLPVASSGTIENVKVVVKGYNNTGAGNQSPGLTRGTYIFCHDVGTYNTSTNTLNGFDQDYIPEDREIKFGNVMKAGDDVAYKETTFMGGILNVFQFNGGDTRPVNASGSVAAGHDGLVPISTTPLQGGVQLRMWNKRATDYYHFRRGNLSDQLNIISSEYFSSGNKTRVYLARGDYYKVHTGQYININTGADGFGGFSRSGWQLITGKNNITDNGKASYFVEVSGNHAGGNIDDVTYEYRQQADEENITSSGNATNPVYADFYHWVKGWPNVTTTSTTADSNGHFQLQNDYTACNTSFFALNMDGTETPRRSMRFSFGSTGFASTSTPAHFRYNHSTVATGPAPTDIWKLHDTNNYRPHIGFKPPIESGMGYDQGSLPKLSVTIFPYANLESTRHYVPGHTMDREAIIKGPTNLIKVSQESTGTYDGKFMAHEESNVNLPSISDQDIANRVVVNDVPPNYVLFSNSLNFIRTLTTDDIYGYASTGPWENPPAGGALTKTNAIKFFYNNQHLTYSHGTAANSLADNTFSFASAEIREESSATSTLVSEANSFTIPTPSTNSSDSEEARLLPVTNNTWSYTGSSPQLVIHYTFNVKVPSHNVITKKVLLSVKAPTTKSCKMEANYNFYHRTVTKTYPFTSFTFPSAQASITGTTDGITGSRTWKLYQANNLYTTFFSGFQDGDPVPSQFTLIGQATSSSNTAGFNYTPFVDTSWHNSNILNLDDDKDQTTFLLIIEQGGTEVARSLHTHHHSESPKARVYITKYFNVKPWMNPDDESMWRHDGFAATPNTLQTFRRGFVPGVACVNGIIDNQDGMNVQPYYIRSSNGQEAPDADEDDQAWRTMYTTPTPTNYLAHENLVQHAYLPLQCNGITNLAATGSNTGLLQDAYSNYSSRKWTFSYLDYPFTSIRPDQATLTTATRGLLRANYGHLNAAQNIKEQLIWKGQVITSSSTIGGISNPVTVGNYTYSFDFANPTYTNHYTFIPVSKVGPYDANDFDGYGPAAFGADSIPELFIFSDPSSAPTPHDPEGLQVRDSNGTTLYDSRIRPLVIHDTQDITQPATPVTIDCSSLKANSRGSFQDHGPVFAPTNETTNTLASTSNPAYFYNVKTQAARHCTRTASDTDDYILYKKTTKHKTTYWALYKGGIGRNSGNTTVQSGYIVVDEGAYYTSTTESSFLFGLIEKSKKRQKGFLGYNNETVSNIAQTAISIDTSMYIGPTYTVTCSAGTGTDIKLSGEDRNGTFNNVVAKTLTLRTGDRLKITFHTANYGIRTAQAFTTGFDVNSSQTINNNGTIGEVHFVPDKVQSYFYTKIGQTATNSFGEIVVTAS